MASTATPPRRPLVTVLGASGLVGSAVTAAFAARRVRLRAVARRRSVVAGTGPAEVQVRKADLTDRGELAAAVEDADVIVHLVKHTAGWRTAELTPDSERANVGVSRDLVEVLRTSGTGRRPPLVIYSGAVSQVGVAPGAPVDGSEPDLPEAAYDKQKLAGERVLKAATADGVVRCLSVRLPTVFGPVRTPGCADSGVITTMVRRALAGEALPLWHDGSVERDLLYVDDIASAVLAACDHAEMLIGGHWPIGSDRGADLGTAFRTIAEVVAERTGSPPVPVVSVPPPRDAPVTDFRSLTVDSSSFRANTGWAPRFSLREAIERTTDALRETGFAGGGSGRSSSEPVAS
ncbi:NAD-dependent epimerase/dehydratase [Saccharopolyspora indica]|uniref:NAD-dependent epimerase/dehydratase family protein n=1 Tax=Saccharopolyspora indica TaxID=1229659 RepID=UPI0022EA6716|nr:NAD-dependent epimerase/dehydratase [Saccharopolyspora indica]MDA3645745.1 NAD-dependent epimerase/dehydratase [Saccharopolyspora indica]